MTLQYPTITIRLDKEFKTVIERQAKREDVTVSELVRKFIETGLHNVRSRRVPIGQICLSKDHRRIVDAVCFNARQPSRTRKQV